MESMIAKEKLDVVRVGCGFDLGFCSSSVGNSGGLGLWWNGFNVNLVSYSNHQMLVEVVEPNGANMWYACGVYGWVDHSQKFKTWDLLRSLKSLVSGPCLFFGDLIEILSSVEKMGGVARNKRVTKAFRDRVDDCEFKDLGF